MFYWNYRGTYVLLTNEELWKLFKELGFSDTDSIGYMYDDDVINRCNKSIFKYLKDYIKTNPEEFNRKYVFRTYYGEEAKKIFPDFLGAYGRAKKKAVFGDWLEGDIIDNAVEKIIHSSTDVIFYVSFISWKWWCPWTFKTTGRISFPANSIEKIVGEVCNFTLMTSSFNIHFNRDYIRITVFKE